MTVKQLTQIERYVGPSTATKPLDCSVGSTFLEEDTSRLFVFDGTGWFPKTQDIVIYDAEGNPLEIEGGRMKVSVDASVVAPEEVVWSNITLRDGQNPSNKLAVLPDGSLKVQLPGSENFAKDLTIQEVTSELELVKAELQTIKTNQLSGDQKVQLYGASLEVVMPRGILSSNSTLYRFNVPAGVKGLSLTLAVYGVTGTLAEDQGIKLTYALIPLGQDLWTNNILGIGGQNISTSATRSGSSSHQLTIYPGLTEVTSGRVHKWDMVATGLRILTRVDVSGNFGSGEGFDCELRMVYIP